MGTGSTHIAVQRHGKRLGRRFGAGQRHGKHGIRSQIPLIVRSVQLYHLAVYPNLVQGILPAQEGSNLLIDIFYGVLHAQAEIPRLAVPKLHGFEPPCTGTGGHCRRASIKLAVPVI